MIRVCRVFVLSADILQSREKYIKFNVFLNEAIEQVCTYLGLREAVPVLLLSVQSSVSA